MSCSEGTPAPFHVRSEPTVQITVYDATRVIRGRGEGSLEMLLPPGLYRVHFESGGSVHTEVVDHESTTDFLHPGPRWRSPVPFSGAATSHHYYVEPAQRLSVEDTCPPLGNAPHSSRLFVFIRRAERDAGPAGLPSEPVTIHDVHGCKLATVSRATAAVDDSDGYVAFSSRVAPGTFRIRAARSRRDVAITIPSGRAAHVFVADVGTIRLDELRVSLVPIATPFDPASPIWPAMESMIAALRTPDRPLPAAARALLPNVLEDDLCFGIAAAYLLWRSKDHPAAAAALARLAKYSALPDVVILDQLTRHGSLTARWSRRTRWLPHSRPAMPDVPPLLRTSLALAMTRPELDSRGIPATGALAQAARTRLHDSVWCTWSPRAWDERWIEPTIQRLRTQDRHHDTTSLARSLALPIQTIREALEALDASTPTVNGRPLTTGDDTVPGYNLEAVLGRGVQSSVFRATRSCDAHKVALKVVPLPDANHRARLHSELQRLEPIQHPQVLWHTARGSLKNAGSIWLEMELCRGSVVDLLAERDTPLPALEALRIILDALAGLAYLHRCGIVHGDIKPENLIVRNNGRVAIADVGMASYRSKTAASRRSAAGVRFASPELVAGGSPTASSDLWSMVATLYFLLTLELPRDEYAGEKRFSAAGDNAIVPIASRRYDVPPELAQCIDRALSADSRPTSAEEVKDQLISVKYRVTATRVVGHNAGVEVRTVVPGAAEIPTSPPSEQTAASRQYRANTAFNPDGTRVVIAGSDGIARVWDAATGKLIFLRLHHHGIVCAAFSPDGTRVVTASRDRTARIWDATSSIPLCLPLQHQHALRSAAFSPDGTRIVTASSDTARVWDAATGKLHLPLQHKGIVLRTAFSPDSNCVVTASSDMTAQVWNATTGQPLSPPLRHSYGVWSAAFSPDGTRALTASKDMTARVWDAATGRPLSPILQHRGGVRSAAFCPDSTRVVTASEDMTARIWDATTGQPLSPALQHQSGVWTATFSPDGTRVLTASQDMTARVWDATTGQPLSPRLQHREPLQSAEFSPDGQRILTQSYRTARVWDTQQYASVLLRDLTSAETGAPRRQPKQVAPRRNERTPLSIPSPVLDDVDDTLDSAWLSPSPLIRRRRHSR